MTHPKINQRTAAEILLTAAEKVITTQQRPIAEAAVLVRDALLADGLIQVFGTGHSRSFAMEIAGRAGGLVPANRISFTDLAYFGDTPLTELMDPQLERDAGLADRIWAVERIHPADVFVICSNSGGNGSTVELGRLAKDRGHRLIVVTSMQHTTKITSRHPSGKKLYELADVVIDNEGPYGDAALDLPAEGGPAGLAITPVSSITSILIAQMLVTEVCGLLLEAGAEVPVLISANIPGGDEHNDRLRARYADRLNPSTP